MRFLTLLATSLSLTVASFADIIVKNGESVAFLGDSITAGGAAQQNKSADALIPNERMHAALGLARRATRLW